MFKILKEKVTVITSESNKSVDAKLKEICILLKESIPYYDWVGFYFKNGDKNELKLGPYAGNLQIILLFLLEKVFADK